MMSIFCVLQMYKGLFKWVTIYRCLGRIFISSCEGMAEGKGGEEKRLPMLNVRIDFRANKKRKIYHCKSFIYKYNYFIN
jgi:hypothetical protein